MKKKFIFLVSIAFALCANGQKVALHSTAGIQHFNGSNGFIEAYNAASPGDTVYLPGGSFNTVQIDKQLYIFGAGHYVDSTQATGKTVINGNLRLKDNAGSTHIEGIDITGHFEFASSPGNSVNNVTLAYSKVSGSLSLNANGSASSGNFTLLRSVVMGTSNFSNAVNTAVFSSFLVDRVYNSYGVLYENNILFYSYGSTTYPTIGGDNNIIKNNIFFCPSNKYAGVGGYANQLFNNLFTSNGPMFGNSATVNGNYHPVPEDEVFVNNLVHNFNYEGNYHLQDPDTYTGTDGTAVGIYGGLFPYKEGAVPSNPHIRFKNIAPASDTDGNLQIEFIIQAQDE